MIRDDSDDIEFLSFFKSENLCRFTLRVDNLSLTYANDEICRVDIFANNALFFAIRLHFFN